MTVREAMQKIGAARQIANSLHKLGADRPFADVFWDAEELLVEYAIMLEDMEVKTNE